MGKSLPPPPPPRANKPTIAATGKAFSIITGDASGADRTLVYAAGGMGKTTLCTLAPKPLFIDLERGARSFEDLARVDGIETFQDLRDCLHSDIVNGYDSLVLDTATKAQALGLEHTILTVPHEKGNTITSIEGYGYGKGYRHNFDTFGMLLGDLDALAVRGIQVILVAHSKVAMAPNPSGDSFERYEPDLQDAKNASIKDAVVQWADNVMFIEFDVDASGGKGRGEGSRTIYTYGTPSRIAKGRRVQTALPFTGPDDGRIWEYLFKGANNVKP